jgi:hypothetical protein
MPNPVASPFVSQAVAILREEAQLLSTATAGVLPTLGANSGVHAPVEQLREQARMLVDTFVRVLGQRPEGLAYLASQTVGTGASGSGSKVASLLVLKAAAPVKPGDMALLSMRLVNDDSEADDCTIFVTDLIGASGGRIPSTHVRVFPRCASIPPAGTAEVSIEVRVPSGTLEGCYTGLLQSDDGESLRALIHVTVSR